jgi:ABC-2 type transport system permease protein
VRRVAGETAPPQQAAPATGTRGNVYQILVPSYTVMFAFFLVNIMARSFISERDIGTLCRLRMAPVSRAGLLLGKTAPFFIISLVQSALLFLFGRLLFGMSWGATPAGLIPVVLCTSLAATTLGLLVATLARTESQVQAYATFLVITMAGISGCLMPRDWQPQLMQQISLITPHAWALIAYDQLLVREHLNWGVVGRGCAMLLAFAAVFFSVGWWRFQTLDEPV